MLAQANSAIEDRFQRRHPTRLTLSTRAVRSIVAPFKSLGTINSCEGRHVEWECSTEISCTESRFTSKDVYLSRGFCAISHRPVKVARVKCVIRERPNKMHIDEQLVGGRGGDEV